LIGVGRALLGLYVGIIASTMAQLPSPASAQQPTAEAMSVSAKRKINLAGRQRMLTQYMAKAFCFAVVGVDDDKAQMNQVFTMHGLFASTLVALRNGSADLEMLPEKNADVLASLDDVEKIWHLYDQAIMQEKMTAVMELNIAVLDAMNRAVTVIEKAYSAANGVVRPEIGAAINIAGRQRMLSQRASKEFCLVVAGYKPDENRANLLQTIALFEKSLAALRDGDAAMSLKKAPSPTIAAQIEKGGEAWSYIRDTLERIAKGDKPSAADLELIAQNNLELLAEMDELVTMFETHDG
jgi:hypothetical protein